MRQDMRRRKKKKPSKLKRNEKMVTLFFTVILRKTELRKTKEKQKLRFCKNICVKNRLQNPARLKLI